MPERRTLFRRWMEAQGLTNAEAAQLLGISADQVRNLKAGTTRGETARPQTPDRRTLLAMAAIVEGLQPYGERPKETGNQVVTEG